MKVDELRTTYDAKTRNTEIIYRGSVDLEIHGTNYDYDNYDEKADSYKKIAYDFYPTIRFDVSMVVTIDGSSFVKLVKLDGESRGTDIMKAGFDEVLKSAQKYIGKTYKIPSRLSYSDGMYLTDLQGNIIKTLDTLENKSLFSIVEKK
jgi:hypothetical protein